MPTLLDRKSPRQFYDAWEFLPSEKREAILRENLEEYVRFARETVPWYQDRLSGYEPDSDQPLGRVPVLQAADLRLLVPPQGTALLSSKNRDFTVFQSGGTTGMPKTTLFSHDELERLNLPNARGFFACGLRAEDRVGNLFAVGGLYMTFIHINRMLQQYGCMNFPFSNHTPPDFVHTVVKLFDVNVLTGIASVVLNALRGMRPLGLDGIRIEKVFYGGEHLFEADKNEIREKFGVKQILAPGYGTVDTWYLGYQCTETPTGVFHAHDDEAYIEIVDEDTGNACQAGTVGMMYATALPRRLTPIIRYRVGDRAKWLHQACPCGRTTPLFELLGRGDDVLRIGYDSIDYAAIQAVVVKIPGLLGSIQMQKDREAGRDRLTLRVETDLEPAKRPAARDELEERLLAARPVLREFLEKETIWPLRIELLDPGQLPRNARTGKLIRVVDAF